MKLKKRFWDTDGDLSQWRKSFVSNSDEQSKFTKNLITSSKVHADSYIDSIVARLHDKTGGRYRAVEKTPDGKFVGNVWDENSIKPNIQSENNIIEYTIIQAGDEELISHIAKESNEFVSITNKAGETQNIKFTREMSESQHKQYRAWLQKK